MEKNQISMFELLGIEDTPEIPFEKQKKGTKGWVIDIQCILTTENGFRKNMVGVTTYRVILDKDSKTDSRGQWQYAHVIEDGCKGDGWLGSPRKLYASRPTWRELQDYARKEYKEPWEIIFAMKNGQAMTRICDYETKKPIDGKDFT